MKRAQSRCRNRERLGRARCEPHPLVTVANQFCLRGLDAPQVPTKVVSYSKKHPELRSQFSSLTTAQFSNKCVDQIVVYKAAKIKQSKMSK